MPSAVETLPGSPEPAPNRLRWTRQQYHAIGDCGILVGLYELIEGEIISKMGQNRPHITAVTLLIKWLIALFGGDYVQGQGPIDVADADNATSEPLPDVAVLAQPITAYMTHSPGPADLLLVAEVSDTTLRFDRTTKAALYARAGIVEYWIVDVDGRQIYAHRQPAPEGYAEIVAYSADEEIATLTRPDAPVRVADLLPPA